MNRADYYIKEADIAHGLYLKEKGAYINQWQGAAVGFKKVIADHALFKTCLTKAAEILKTANK